MVETLLIIGTWLVHIFSAVSIYCLVTECPDKLKENLNKAK